MTRSGEERDDAAEVHHLGEPVGHADRTPVAEQGASGAARPQRVERRGREGDAEDDEGEPRRVAGDEPEAGLVVAVGQQGAHDHRARRGGRRERGGQGAPAAGRAPRLGGFQG
ncbi:MAG TPA: hypothetical protein VKB65_08310, partial [Myxococcota bacterium]|nr:hypothetical protein [Myxococcota bacterium]